MTTKQSVELRVQSGEEKTSSNFVLFLYLLLRDELPVGRLERLIDAYVYNDATDDVRRDTSLTNGFVARYAKNVVMRLSAGHAHVYRVRDRHTGQFIDGTDEYEWEESGKVWRSFSALKKYMSSMRKNLKGCTPDHIEVVKYALVEVDSEDIVTAFADKSERKSMNRVKVIEYRDEK